MRISSMDTQSWYLCLPGWHDLVVVPMKDPIIQVKQGERIALECTLWQLIYLHIFRGDIKLKEKEDVKLLLNFEEVEPPEDTEL